MATTLLEKYKTLLPTLLPRGKLWNPKEQPEFKKLLDSFAVELCRVEERGRDLLREADPRIALELLDDWERLLALPDECSPPAPTLDERRDQILRALTNLGGLSKEFYEFIGAQLGFTIEVNNSINKVIVIMDFTISSVFEIIRLIQYIQPISSFIGFRFPFQFRILNS